MAETFNVDGEPFVVTDGGGETFKVIGDAMNADEIEQFIRRDIREIGPSRVGPDDIAQVIDNAVNLLGLVLVGANPTYFNVRKSFTAPTHIFALPDNVHEVSDVKDMDDSAVSVSGAADNGSGLIQITTDEAHGWATGYVITHHDIGGTVEANDTYKITVVDTLNYTLDGSTFSNTYTSGGKAFRETEDFTKIVRKPIGESNNATEEYYTRGNNIIIDDIEFENDILIEYHSLPSSISDIPGRFHYGIVNFGVLSLIVLPKFDTQHYPDKSAVRKFHEVLWNNCLLSAKNFKTSSEFNNLSDVKRIKRRI